MAAALALVMGHLSFASHSRLARSLLPVAPVLCLLMAGTSSCRSPEAPPQSRADEAFETDMLRRYTDIAYEGYGDASEGARRLLIAVEALTDQPSQARLDAARTAWVGARTPYLQTESFRFYDGPIDRVEGFLNTWPIDENYVDSGATAASPGIIQNVAQYPRLDAELLASLNEKEGETNISTGFHVIEYLLWGADNSPSSPGNRPYLDYVTSTPGKIRDEKLEHSALMARRRGTYLRVASQLLADQLNQLASEWSSAGNNYRAQFLRLPHKEALALVVKGMGTFSGPELSGERLSVAYETKDQANEHSCFSDNTHNDIIDDTLGIQNACLGRHLRLDGSESTGPGLCALLARTDQAAASRLGHDLAASVLSARSIPPPFDQAIQGDDTAPGRQAVLRTIKALEKQTNSLASAAALLGLGVSLAHAKLQ